GVNEKARATFRLSPADIGRPFKDLTLSYRPAELRSKLETALAAKVPVVEKGVQWNGEDGSPETYDVHITPVSDGGLRGVTIFFADVTDSQVLRTELESSKRQLETAYEEVQSTVEELETTNEELQSTNEELETTNEELQSTNEELETMNEELQSTNE